MTPRITPEGPDDREETAADEPVRAPSRSERAQTSLEERLARPAPTVGLSGQEAAEYVGVSWPTLRKTLLEHDIPCLHLGTRWKIDVAVLDERLHRIAEAG